MLVVLSPSKGQEFAFPAPTDQYSQPRSLGESADLIDILRQYSAPKIGELMQISEQLSELNFDRYRSFSLPFSLANAKQALFAFQGDVYSGIDRETMDGGDLEFAQQHLRMISGLYGLLRPLDLIQPYRLEMKTALANSKGKNLYQFWDSKITGLIDADQPDSEEPWLINLASNEYFKAVKPKLLNSRLLNINFKEIKEGKARVVAIFAKRARGMMADYIIRQRLTSAEGLKSFTAGGYAFDPELSDDKQWTFTRPQPQKRDAGSGLAQIKNLGPRSEEMLNAVGIKSREDLEKLGALMAYIKVREHHPKGVSLNLLYAMEAGLRDIHWSQLPAEERSHLILSLDQYKEPEE